MAGTSINCLAIVLKELGWSYTRLIAELRRQAAIDGVVLPKTESLIQLIGRWVNNHQQPDDFYRDPLSPPFLKRGIVGLPASCYSCCRRARGTTWPGRRSMPDHPPTRPRNAPCA